MKIDRVIWITLDRAKERQRHFGRNLEHLSGWPVQRFLGYDAHALKMDNEWNSGPVLEGAGAGILGCYLSHLALIQQAVMSGENILVLEDDVVLVPDFRAKLEGVLERFEEALPIHSILLLAGELGKGGTAAYVVIGARGSDLLRQMLNEREGGFSHFLQTHPGYMGSAQSVLAHQNKRLPGHLGGRNAMEASRLSQAEIRERSWSQWGEDRIVSEYFDAQREAQPERKPRFLEIGAWDGVRDSNCYKLALEGWHGVSIEPNPYHFLRLHQTYLGNKQVETLCALVAPDHQIRTLHLNRDGLSTSDANNFEKLRKEAVFAGHCHAVAITLAELAETFGKDFDFVSIDAEGLDQAIVRSGSKAGFWEQVKVICVERWRPMEEGDQQYAMEWDCALREAGFTRELAATEGNLIWAKI